MVSTIQIFRYSVCVLVVVMSGCANHPLDCATGLIAWDDCLPGTAGYNIRQRGKANLEAARETQKQNDDEQCRSFGATPGTDVYVNCRLKLLQIESENSNSQEQNRAALARAIIANQQKNRPQPVQPYVMPTTTTTQCSSIVNGSILNTTCSQ